MVVVTLRPSKNTTNQSEVRAHASWHGVTQPTGRGSSPLHPAKYPTSQSEMTGNTPLCMVSLSERGGGGLHRKTQQRIRPTKKRQHAGHTLLCMVALVTDKRVCDLPPIQVECHTAVGMTTWPDITRTHPLTATKTPTLKTQETDSSSSGLRMQTLNERTRPFHYAPHKEDIQSGIIHLTGSLATGTSDPANNKKHT